MQISVDPPTEKRGRALIEEVIDPEIGRFEEWFAEVGDTEGAELQPKTGDDGVHRGGLS